MTGWGEDLDGFFHDAADGPCRQLDRTELKAAVYLQQRSNPSCRSRR
ncbi:hypothetical protein [uncultured Acidaminococcus sp.]|nr:hypothetical protein [uncultured Acidaminococcus sp.]